MGSGGKIFIYCERGLDPGFLAEPLNALTNAAFVVAGLAALVLIRRRPAARRAAGPYVLVALMIAIGMGSFLFHTFATRWAAIADVAPIGLFMLVYLFLALRGFLDWPVWAAGLGTLGFAGALRAARAVRCTAEGEVVLGGAGGVCLNGSVGYLPALIAMLLIGGWLLWRRHAAWRGVLAAGLAFALSLTFRTLDREVCAATVLAGVPIGTHFLWHLLNALVLFLLARAYVLHGVGRRRTPGSRGARDHGGQTGGPVID
jgi:hypothetical protein